MLPRFYAPHIDAGLAVVTLPADEARHLTRVLRLGAGDEVAVFDGRGSEFRAVVEVAVRETASLRLLEPLPVTPALSVSAVVAQAMLKGSSMDDAMRDATMMGADAIDPLLTAHSDVKASFARRTETLERWRRVALASVKQSRRATLPVISEPRTLEAWLDGSRFDLKLLFVEPSAACQPQPLRSLLEGRTPARAAVLLGPEGGWAADEIDAAVRRGCVPVTLGPLTLRADSMAVASLAAVAALWER
ncbi:MAG: RsmE family RNA methyltransferase [Vicinamibacterales bacterium]